MFAMWFGISFLLLAPAFSYPLMAAATVIPVRPDVLDWGVAALALVLGTAVRSKIGKQAFEGVLGSALAFFLFGIGIKLLAGAA